MCIFWAVFVQLSKRQTAVGLIWSLLEMSRKMEVIKHLLEDHYSCCWLHSLNLQLVFEHLIIETVPIFSYRSVSFMSPPLYVHIQVSTAS